MSGARVLAVIPARGGSKGLPGKNVRSFAGIPLIGHSVLCARRCPEFTRTVVSTDSPGIARVARRFGADAPFLRPTRLAADRTPLWPVLRHALARVEREEGRPYDYLAVLDPTSPTRLPSDVSEALRRLHGEAAADGIVAASEPDFNPVWHTVLERNGWMRDWSPDGGRYSRRQEAPRLLRINGLLYIWRAEFVRRETGGWRGGRTLLYETPELRASSIDDLGQFRKTEALVLAGLIRLPWLKRRKAR